MRIFGSTRAARLWLLWVVLAAFYLLSAPDSRYEADDAYDYAAAVESAEFAEMLNPQHPIYLPVNRVLYNGARTVASGLRALDFMAVLGAFMGAGTVIAFYFLLKEWLGASRRQAAFGAGSLGASYAFWRYSAEAEVYALAALAVVLLLFAAVKLPLRTWTMPVIAALALLAFLAHSVNAAALVILPFVLYSRGWRVRRILVTGLIASLLLVTATYAIYQVARDAPHGLATETSYAGFYGGEGITSQADSRDLVLAVGVIGTRIVAANSLLIFQPVRDAVVDAVPNRVVDDEFRMAETNPRWVAVTGVFTLLLVIGGLLVVLWESAQGLANDRNAETYMLLAWVVIYFVGVAMGGVATGFEGWILLLIPLWALITNLMISADARGMILVALPVILLLHSFVGGFLPVYLGEYRQESLGSWLAANGRPGDLLLTADSAGLARYIAYQSETHSAHIGYQGQEQVAVDMIENLSAMIENEEDTSEIASYLEDRGALSGYEPVSSDSGRLFMGRDMFAPPAWLEVAKPESAAALRELGQRHDHLFEPVPGADHILVRATD